MTRFEMTIPHGSVEAKRKRLKGFGMSRGDKAEFLACWLLTKVYRTAAVRGLRISSFRAIRENLDGLWFYCDAKQNT
jgi:hypothetical protein